jgi:hypothetical protein
MGIFYDPTKPAANDKPANDQSPMQMNFASIKTLIDVDHVDFNNAQYGQHNQVTFAANNVPTVPTTPPVLFTNNVLGLAQLFYYTGDVPNGAQQYVSGANGSTMAFGGIIIKWGLQMNAANNTTVNFVSDFPNDCFAVTVSGGLATGTQPTININTASEGPSGFTLKITGTTPVNVFYIAIGN